MWLSADEQAILKFVNSAELFRFIEEAHVPAYLGGANTTDFTVAPEGCRPLVEICQNYGINREEAIKFMKKYQIIIDEAKGLVSNPGPREELKIKKKQIEDQNNNNNNNKEIIQSFDKMFIQIPI